MENIFQIRMTSKFILSDFRGKI